MIINIKSAIGTICICVFVGSFNASAAIISADWNAAGDNLITQVTGTGVGSGLEWLDLTATSGRTYNDISTKFGAGQEFEGWRYATGAEISAFFDAFGGDNAFYTGFSTQNNGLFDVIAPFWGDVNCANTGCVVGDGYSFFLTADSLSPSSHAVGLAYDSQAASDPISTDYFRINHLTISSNAKIKAAGSALVRSPVVPVPAAVWLFGSGLIGLIGLARRKV